MKKLKLGLLSLVVMSSFYATVSVSANKVDVKEQTISSELSFTEVAQNTDFTITDDRGIDVTDEYQNFISDKFTPSITRLMTLSKTWKAYRSQWASEYRPAYLEINAPSGYLKNWKGRVYLVKTNNWDTINGAWVTLDYSGTVTCIAN